MSQERMNKFLHGCFVCIEVWIVMLLIISLASQGKRYINRQHHIYAPEELSAPKIIHVKAKKYSCYEKKRLEYEKKDYVLLRIDDTACYWTPEDIEASILNQTVTTSITTLSFSVKRSGLDKFLYGDDEVTYVKYGILGDDEFSPEEIEYYRNLAARKVTCSVYSLWNFSESESYQDFVTNENRF